MGAEPFLILHKVRGEPAFDIAIKLQIGDEEGWIIPTSGHRAYPFRYWPLNELAEDNPSLRCHILYPQEEIMDEWDEVSDHYSVGRAPAPAPLDILSTLGISEKPIKRRSL